MNTLEPQLLQSTMISDFLDAEESVITSAKLACFDPQNHDKNELPRFGLRRPEFCLGLAGETPAFEAFAARSAVCV